MDKKYYIKINKTNIYVSKEIYYTYNRAKWREHKNRCIRAKKELSFDANLFDSIEFSNITKVETLVEYRFLLERLKIALQQLNDYEYNLIYSLFYLEKTEREVANDINIPQSTINYQKRRILKTLKNFLD